jgi:Mitochondrial ribosomal protein L37
MDFSLEQLSTVRSIAMNRGQEGLSLHFLHDARRCERSEPCCTATINVDIRPLSKQSSGLVKMMIPTVPNLRTHHCSTMVLRYICTRIRPTIRTLHASCRAAAAAKPFVASNITPDTSTAAPFPQKERPADNDPTFIHPPSSVKAGSALKGLQILKDRPEIIALPDDYYPDWLWELFEDPKSVEDRVATRRALDGKKKIFLDQQKEEEIEKKLIESESIGLRKLGSPKRTTEEKNEMRRTRQNAAWLLNREREYNGDPPQFKMPSERNVKFHKRINKQKIKHDNYLRSRGMK